jgi:chromosome segregation ATPase
LLFPSSCRNSSSSNFPLRCPCLRRRSTSLCPPCPAAASTTVLTEDDEYGSNASSDDEEEDVKPRARRATAKAAARLDDESSGDDVPSASGNKLKRKQMATVGAPPQRTQLTKAELELGATLDLSRDELLNMTSDALEEHAKRLASQRTLTPEEQKRFKRQRRLIKNRESAQLSRMRKKAYVDELERQIADLKEEKDEIRRRADNAERQLAQARAETAQLRALLAQNPALAAPLSSLAMPEVPVAVELESSKRRRGAGGVTLL